MITVRASEERGLARHGWLESRHTFSFADYHDPAHMGFRALRVINEDRVQPGEGFGSHPHRDMEILTYVIQGALAHRDSTGSAGVIRPGDVQRMSAGTGIVHSEFNASREEPVHFLQIWIVPEHPGLAPGYEQRTFPLAERTGRLRLLAAPDGRDGALRLHQDASVWGALLPAGSRVAHALAPGRHAWLQMVKGKLSLNGTPLAAGDGAAAEGEERLVLEAGDEAEILLFDLA
jgi:redox-sensitive bicupin YhaK (pirin superfamily)